MKSLSDKGSHLRNMLTCTIESLHGYTMSHPQGNNIQEPSLMEKAPKLLYCEKK